MIKKILLGVAALIAVVLVLILIIAATRPADFRVERTARLTAPRSALFDQVNDHRKFALWNPFMKLDPNVKNTFTGPPSGVGAICSWDGNSQVGAGSCTIIESKAGRTRALPSGLETADARNGNGRLHF